MSTAVLPRNSSYFVSHLCELALRMRSAVDHSIRTSTAGELSRISGIRGGDTIYQLDVHSEEVLLSYCDEWSREAPFLLVAEGLEGGRSLFPSDADPEHLAFTMIVDPVDGTRGLMYGKRSAWALLAIAPPPQGAFYPTLAHIQVAVQAELPTARAALADVLWAAKGEGVQGETHDLHTGEKVSFVPRPSTANTLIGGFASFTKFFPGIKAAMATLEEELYEELLGPPTDTATVFDDQYISTGGQLYEMMVGHDRFLTDLRPLLKSVAPQICCHPYDLCTALIAQEAGVIVTDPWGNPPREPLDTSSPVAWVAFANEDLRRDIQPVLQRLLQKVL